MRLLPTNMETLLFLKYSLRALNWQVDLENPPDFFAQPNKCQNDKIIIQETEEELDTMDEDEDLPNLVLESEEEEPEEA